MWDRLKIIPFDVQFFGDEDDKALDAKLAKEAPGILAWAVEGARLYYREGLKFPKRLEALVADLQAEADTIGQAVHALTLDDTDACVDRGELFKRVVAYCVEQAIKPPTEDDFAAAMKELGYRLSALEWNPSTKKPEKQYAGLRFRAPGV